MAVHSGAGIDRDTETAGGDILKTDIYTALYNIYDIHCIVHRDHSYNIHCTASGSFSQKS